jgi:molybdate transport system substrate-binding protein
VRARRRTAVLAAALLPALSLTGCGSSGSASGRETGTLTVLAASSLTEAFTTIARDFEREHPRTHVRLSFDSSATLAEQVDQGAPADVLATADQETMRTVVAAGNTAGRPTVFATNHLVLAVPKGDPAHIRRFRDIARPGVEYVVCVTSAPCGKLAAKVLAASGITAEPASEEVDVKAVLTKVRLDEADAGLVYASDIVTAGDQVEQVDVPTAHQNLNTYPIAALSGAAKPALARAWVRLVTSGTGRKVLAHDGFGAP